MKKKKVLRNKEYFYEVNIRHSGTVLAKTGAGAKTAIRKIFKKYGDKIITDMDIDIYLKD